MKRKCEQIYQPRPGSDNALAFVSYLECLAGFGNNPDSSPDELIDENQNMDRAALARLRRTLGKGMNEAFEAFPYVARWTEGLNTWHEQCYYLVAALFAMYSAKHRARSWHHEQNLKRHQRNLGASFLGLNAKMQEQGQTDERSKSVERRFTALLVSRRNDLSERLRHAVSLLAAHRVPVDWVQLLDDLRWWEQGERAASSRSFFISPQRQWANSFWRVTDEGSQSSGNQQSNENNDQQLEV